MWTGVLCLQVARLQAAEQRRLQQQLYQRQHSTQHSASSSSSDWGAAAPPVDRLLPAASGSAAAAAGLETFLDQLAAAVHAVLLREQADMMQQLLAKAAAAAAAAAAAVDDRASSSSSSSSGDAEGSATVSAAAAAAATVEQQVSVAAAIPSSSSNSSSRFSHAPGPLSAYLAEILWGFAKLNHNPEDESLAQLWVEGFTSVAAAAADGVSFSQMLWALGQLQLWPGEEVMGSLAAELGRRMAAAAATETAAAAAAAPGASSSLGVAELPAVREQQLLGARAVSNILWSFAALGYSPPPEVSARVWAGSAQTLAYASPQALGNMLWAIASLELAPSSSWMVEWQEAALLGLQQQHWNCADLANAAWALGNFAGSAKLR
jgi:hypothetical protein